MNTYRVMGKYQMWNNETMPREEFTEIVLAGDVVDAIRICNEKYRNAEIIVALLRDANVLEQKNLTKTESYDEGISDQIE